MTARPNSSTANPPAKKVRNRPTARQGDLDRSQILIFSDGGAARGHFDRERLALTADFLEKLNRRVRRVAWLNPMPRTRWTATTAEAIARLVPMLEVSQHGLHEADPSPPRPRLAHDR